MYKDSLQAQQNFNTDAPSLSCAKHYTALGEERMCTNIHQILENDCLKEAVTEKRCVETSTVLSDVQLACCWQYCAFPHNKRDVCIWNIHNPLLQSLELKGHHQSVTALTFGHHSEPTLLCSAAEDYVIIWDMEACQMRIQQGSVLTGTIVGTLLGKVLYLCFSPDDQMMAACADNKIYVLNCKQEDVLAVFKAHLGVVTAAEFCPWQPNILVSISEDRTFKVWNLTNKLLLYQSAVLSSSPLLSLCMDSRAKQFITGSANGQLDIFTSLIGQQCHRVLHIDLQKEQQKYNFKILEKNRLSENSDVECTSSLSNCGALHYSSVSINDNDLESGSYACMEFPVLRMIHCEYLLSSLLKKDSSVPGNSSSLWVGTIQGIFNINLATGEFDAAVQLEDHLGLSIRTAGSYAIGIRSTDKIFCLLSSMFGKHIVLLEIDLHELARKCLQSKNQGEALCVIARAPLLPTSLLNCDAKQKEKSAVLSKMVSSVKDKPVVFHTKVKSSGYTSAPSINMFTPKLNPPKHASSALKEKNNSLKGITKEYPLDSLAPSKLSARVDVSNQPTPVCCIQYSGDGKLLAVGLADKSMLVYNASLSGSPAVFTGHDGAVNCLDWTQNNKWLLTASEDRSLWIWPVRGSTPALMLGLETLSRPARSAQFYYMDKFLLFSSGSEFQLHKYHLDTSRDDIKSYRKKSKHKLVGKFKMAATQEISCLSAVNDFYSYIVLTAGTNRALEVFDLNVGQSVVTVPDAHTRPVHQICQNNGSVFSSQPSELYNLFLTTAVTDGIKLWDLRTLRAVRRYEGHQNRCQHCGIALSPCGRFLATGSEDKCAYVFELGSSNFIHKLTGHTDTVINLAFSCSAPKLTTATLDGKLQLFVP
ncbi:WD repeat-containing protein 27 isoform X2 [Hypanus sabinus]|uniref:WD repeat-containing protein 27 isoform X2 n=1 Tax=Hypanus sabinus TaxID=79690 RepID=UPI0028C4CFC7|nr:WD repeat-containing protein 27 isoform X2 [Hypanus sabinus]